MGYTNIPFSTSIVPLYSITYAINSTLIRLPASRVLSCLLQTNNQTQKLEEPVSSVFNLLAI